VRRPIRIAHCAVAVTFLVAATACAAHDDSIAYGAPDGSHSEICAPAKPGERYLVGDSVGPSQEPIRIDSFELVDARGMTLLDSWLLPPGSDGVGALEYPPVDFAPWQSRTVAIGATVKAGDVVPIVFEVERTGEATGRASAVTIGYTVDGGSFHHTGTLGIELAMPCD
jgi:hypothetical protein